MVYILGLLIIHSFFVQMPAQILSWVVFVAAWTMAACGCLVSTGMPAAVELTDYSQEVSVVDDNGDLGFCGLRATTRDIRSALDYFPQFTRRAIVAQQLPRAHPAA